MTFDYWSEIQVFIKERDVEQLRNYFNEKHIIENDKFVNNSEYMLSYIIIIIGKEWNDFEPIVDFMVNLGIPKIYNYEQNPLLHCIEYKNYNLFRYLMNRHNFSLYVTDYEKDIPYIAKYCLCDYDLFIDIYNKIEYKIWEKMNPLYHAALNYNIKAIVFLTEQGFSLDTDIPDLNYILSQMIYEKEYVLVRTLLESV